MSDLYDECPDDVWLYQELPPGFLKCPECGKELAHFSGLEHIPEFYYCPSCSDKAFDERGKVLFHLGD